MKEFDIHLDIYDTMNNIVPVFTQFDTGGLLYLFLTERGKYLQLDKFEHFVKAKVVKPDGYAIEAACEIADEMKGIVLFRLPDQVCVTPGVLEAIVDIIDADKHKTSTHRFKLEVRDYLYDNGEIESSPEFPIIQTILAEVNDFAEQINLFAKEIEEFRDKLNSAIDITPGEMNGYINVNGEEILVYDHQLNTHVHTQRVPSELWIVKHNLGRHPSVSIVDSGGNIVFGDIQYEDRDTVILTFSAEFSGTAYFN